MRIFVFEFVTGGGLAGTPLPPSLTREADLMVRALVRDLRDCPGVHVLCGRDPRLPPVTGAEPLLPVAGESAEALFARGIARADAVWPTAPETGGLLARLAEMVLQAEKQLLGCHPVAVRVATSKRATAQVLSRVGVPVAPTIGPADAMPPLPGRWVVKPDDGAGSDGVRIVAGCLEAASVLRDTSAARVAQPWIEGEPASLSLLCSAQGARVLSANRQVLRIVEDRPVLARLLVNAIPADASLVSIGQGVAQAIPGLWGYVGVDFVMTGGGPVVLEVNPRLTTSYCGLRPALGLNLAAMVLSLLDGRPPTKLHPAQSAGTHEVVLGAATGA